MGLGNTYKSSVSPIIIPSLKVFKNKLINQNINIKGIAIGKSHCLSWDSNGHIYSFGDAMDGKLGIKIPKH